MPLRCDMDTHRSLWLVCARPLPLICLQTMTWCPSPCNTQRIIHISIVRLLTGLPGGLDLRAGGLAVLDARPRDAAGVRRHGRQPGRRRRAAAVLHQRIRGAAARRSGFHGADQDALSNPKA